MIVLLDSNILDLLATPINKALSDDEKLLAEVYQCTEWFYRLLSKSVRIMTSDLCDYETRREFILIKSQSVEELDKLRDLIEFEKLDITVLKKAAELWAEARALGKPNKDRENIDVDVILAAHWCILMKRFPGRQVVLATKNTDDFENVTVCANWMEITYL